MAGLTLKNVRKQFKNSEKAVVENISIQVDPDEFLVLLGPSGCGKTTLLRMISGLVKPTEGKILIDDVDVTEMEPQERGVGMVFQNYALYPHFNIHKNLSFALEIAGQKKSVRNRRINEVGELLDIKKHFKKKQDMLSGGERQRVAMGRAMVNNCKVYLFDEPLSNLDNELRERLRPEILKQFHELHVPFVYVTHDQVDAMTMGTKVAVLNDGVVQQLGTPDEIYNHPENVFVAGFMGSPKMNFLRGQVQCTEEVYKVQIGEISISLDGMNAELELYLGQEVIFGIRPEDILTTKGGVDSGLSLQKIDCTLTRYEHLGNKIQLFADFQGDSICVMAPVMVRAKVGEQMSVYLNRNKFHLYDGQTEQRIN